MPKTTQYYELEEKKKEMEMDLWQGAEGKHEIKFLLEWQPTLEEIDKNLLRFNIFN